MKKCGLCKSTLVSKNKGSLIKCAYQGVRNVSFSGNFAYVLNGWPPNVIFSTHKKTPKKQNHKKKQHQKIKTRYHLLKFDITAKQYLHKKIAQSWRKTWLSTIWQNPSTFRHKSAKTSWEANLYSFWMISYYDVIGGNNIFKVNVESLEQSVKYVQS